MDIPVFSPKHWNQKVILVKAPRSQHTLKKLFNTSTTRSYCQIERLTERHLPPPPPPPLPSRNKHRAPQRRSLCFTNGAPASATTVFTNAAAVSAAAASSVLLASTFTDTQRRVGDRVQGSEPETQGWNAAGGEQQGRKKGKTADERIPNEATDKEKSRALS